MAPPTHRRGAPGATAALTLTLALAASAARATAAADDAADMRGDATPAGRALQAAALGVCADAALAGRAT